MVIPLVSIQDTDRNRTQSKTNARKKEKWIVENCYQEEEAGKAEQQVAAIMKQNSRRKKSMERKQGKTKENVNSYKFSYVVSPITYQRVPSIKQCRSPL